MYVFLHTQVAHTLLPPLVWVCTLLAVTLLGWGCWCMHACGNVRAEIPYMITVCVCLAQHFSRVKPQVIISCILSCSSLSLLLFIVRPKHMPFPCPTGLSVAGRSRWSCHYQHQCRPWNAQGQLLALAPHRPPTPPGTRACGD